VRGDATASGTRRATLDVPGTSVSLSTIRVFVTRALSPASDDDDRIEDLRLAVDEICARPDGDRISVALLIDPDRCVIVCDGVAAPANDDDGVLRERLLDALVPDIEWSRTEHGRGSARFTVPLQ
jgi:hypothetical protein